MNRIDREIEATVTDVSHWTFLVPDQIMIEWGLEISKGLNMINIFLRKKSYEPVWCVICSFLLEGFSIITKCNSFDIFSLDMTIFCVNF